MTSYRAVQDIRDRMVALQGAINAACLGESTEEIGTQSAKAMAMVDEMLQVLRSGRAQSDAGQASEHDRALLQAADRALTQAWESAEKVALGTSTAEMRARALDFKTLADFADAYINAALGTEL